MTVTVAKPGEPDFALATAVQTCPRIHPESVDPRSFIHKPLGADGWPVRLPRGRHGPGRARTLPPSPADLGDQADHAPHQLPRGEITSGADVNITQSQPTLLLPPETVPD